MAPICRALPPLLLLCACRAGALEIVSINATAVPIEGGALISMRLRSPMRGARNVTCKFAWRMDSWALGAEWEGWPRADDPRDVLCGPMPPLPAEGPIDIRLVADNVSSNELPLWTFATFSAAPGMTPYYGSEGGNLLVRVNDSSLPTEGGSAKGGSARAYELTAVTADANAVLLDRVQVLGGDVRRALPMDLEPLGNATDVQVNLSLRLPSGSVLHRQVRLLRVAETRPGAVAVDHSTRGILVDGQPFFPISWMTTADSFGTGFMVTAMAQMARRGANSVMIYNLGDVGAERLPGAGPNVLAEVEVRQMMDAAQALGLKVQLHIIKMVLPISKTGGSKDEWDKLEGFVLRWRSHPALLAWYVADDFSGPHLPKVYDRLKELDPFHLVSMAIAGVGEAWDPTYLRGADVVMPENYPSDPRISFDTMHILGYFPYDWSPRVDCGMAWAEKVLSTAMYRVELYNSIAAGASGVIWFAHRTLPGEWNEPGPLFDASGVLGRELLDLVPSALVTETTAAGTDGTPAQPSLDAISGVTQDGRSALVHATARREASGCIHLILVNNEDEPVKATVQFARPTPGIYEPGSLHRAAGIVPFEQPLPGQGRLVAVVNGSVSEWLPSWGTQVFRFNGTSGCARPPAGQVEEGHNLVANPSFEESSSYTAAPDAWSCDESIALDRACFADASVAREGRRSGRFATGAEVGSFRIRVPVALDRARAGQIYNFSAWVRGDVAGQTVSLQRVRTEGTVAFEEELAYVSVGATWTHVQTLFTMPPLAEDQAPPLALAVTKPGVLWLDDVRLVPPSAPESGNMVA